jgi:L-threonylcarbamoyladenylate synthase
MGAVPDDGWARDVAETLRAGGVAILPTDTVYGLCCATSRRDAFERLYEIKERPADKAMAVIVSSWHALEGMAHFESWQKALFDDVLPGALTFVVRATEQALPHLVSERGTIAFRVPDSKPILAVAAALSEPIVATSANVSGQPAPASIDEIDPRIVTAADVVVDAGTCPRGVASTVVDLTTDAPSIVREGAVEAREILAAVERARKRAHEP